MQAQRFGRRPWSFYALAAFFTLFVLFLYGPMSAIYILSFQGPNGGLTFPLNGVSLNWFYALFQQQRAPETPPPTRTTPRDDTLVEKVVKSSEFKYAMRYAARSIVRGMFGTGRR